MVPKGRIKRASIDDINVDYSSILDQEDRLRRWSEDVVDHRLRDSVRLAKLYRQIQRQVYCRQESDIPSIEDDSVTDNLLQETENLRRSSLSSMSKVDTKRKSTTMRRAILKQTVLDSSCVKVNGVEKTEDNII